MTDGRNLNILQSGRQMLRAFGGVNETYGCSEAELSSSLNFSGRGYPALQTRATRKKVREVQDVNGMYHLNGLVICRGTTLEYTPDADESRAGAVVLENALTDNEKAMTGMGTKVLIWPDKKAFDTVSGELTDLAAAWTLSGGTMTVTPCDGEGRTYAPDGVGTTEPESPADGQLFLKGDAESPYGAGSVLLKYSAKNKKWSEILLTSLRLHCPGLGSVLKEGDTVTVSGMPGTVCSAAAAGLNGEVSISTLDGDDVITTLAVPEDSTRYYGSWTVTATGTSWRSADGKVTENEAAAAPVKLERRVPDLDFVTEQGNRVWGCSREENSIYACALGDPTNWYSYRGIASDSYAVSVGSDGAFTGAADPEREVSGEDETGLKFEAVTGDIGLAVPDDKYISRVTLRMDALAHTVLTVAVSYDGGDWETVSSCAVTRDHQRVNLPFVPRRHDTMRLRFAGTGQMVLRSMAFTFADAAGARVSGAVPRR